MTGTSVIITWFTGPTTEVETYEFPLPVAAGPRLSSAVSAARKQLQPWQRTPAVAALDERLRAS